MPPQIPSKVNPHEYNLLCILLQLLFEEWQKESKGDAKEYISNYTHEDLLWIVFGVALVASLYLETDGTKTIHQGWSGSDVCEHFVLWFVI